MLPVIEAGLADLVDSDHCVHREIGEGIWLQDAAGHSPGSVVINAQRRGARAVFAGDILHHPVQVIRSDIPFFVDEDPAAACVTRRNLLAQCADLDAVMFPAHFPEPAGGRVRRGSQGFSYQFV